MERLLTCFFDPPASADSFTLSLADILGRHLPAGKDASALLAEMGQRFAELTRHCEPEPTPTIVNISGLPASGKTLFAQTHLKPETGYFYLAFDDIMESLTDYQTAAAHDAEAAFKVWEMPARIIGYGWLAACVTKRFSFIFEHSNANHHHIALYHTLRFVHNYRVRMYHIDSPPEVVIPRLAGRQRFFDPDAVLARWKVMTYLREAYRAVADEYYCITTENS